MPGKHAIFSPSGFKALMLCPAKPAMERGLPDESSDYADEGTAAHFLASWCLTHGEQAPAHLGEFIVVYPDGPSWNGARPVAGASSAFEVTDEMAEAVQVYIDLVRGLAGDSELLVEQPLPIGHITGEEGAEGTGDAVILRDGEIIVIDLKYGRGVEVSAMHNPQLMLYGLGALEKFALMGDFRQVCLIISQPRITETRSEFLIHAGTLIEWGLNVADPAAQLARQVYDSGVPEVMAKPHPDACRFCKAKGTCPALSDATEVALQAEFTDLTTADATTQQEIVKQLIERVPVDKLGAKMDAVELVEMWCKAIRGRVESELLANRAVPGWKLVPGRRSARQWADADEAEKTLKAMRLKKDAMYELKLISPTTAEKVLKAQPKRWKKVAPLIVQSDGLPSVAPASDPRPALELKPLESEFSAITEGAEDLV